MTRTPAACALLWVLLAPPAQADPASDPVLVSNVTRYDRYAHADESIRLKCGFERLLPQEIAEQSPRVGLVVRPEPRDGLLLDLAILNLSRKWRVVVTGRYLDHGALVGSFRAERNVVFGTGGTCGAFERLAGIIAGDIAEFLQGPRLAAVLGEPF